MQALFSILVAATLATSTDVTQDFDLQVGDLAPAFAMKTTTGASFASRDEADKAVLMVFFATWCEPCKKEVPVIQRAHAYWTSRGVTVVHVGQKEKPEVLGPFADSLGITWTVVPDTFGLLSRRYGASQLPHVVIIDKQGKIAWQHRGIAADLENALNAELARATGAPAPDATAATAATAVVAAAPTPASEATATPVLEKTYHLARPPSHDDVLMTWQPLTAFLEQRLHANVRLATEESYAAYLAALKRAKYDIANAGPVLAYEVRETYEPIAKLIRRGELKYFGEIFAMKAGKHPPRSLADLRGKSIALVSPDSASGGVFPTLALLDAHLKPGKDIKIIWKGTHAAVVDAVRQRKVAAGACFQGCRELAWGATPNRFTAVLTMTDAIPPEVLMLRRGLPEEEKRALTAAIMSMSPSQAADDAGARSLLERISGEQPITDVVPTAPGDLDGVAAALQRIEQHNGRGE